MNCQTCFAVYDNIGMHLRSTVAIPVYVRHSLVWTEGGGKLDIMVGPKQNMGKMVQARRRHCANILQSHPICRLQLEDVVVSMTMPRSVTNCALMPSQGRFTFDTTTKTLQWEIGKIDMSRPPNLRGTVCEKRAAIRIVEHSE